MGDLVRQQLRTGHTWVASIASVVALVFSGYNFSQLQEDPQTIVSLPLSLKMERWGESVSVFVQPTVATRFDTEDVEMVTTVRLRLRPRAAGTEPEFYWKQNVSWWINRTAKVLDKTSMHYEFVADPAPFIVAQTEPKQPVMQFTTHTWKLAPGHFDGTLTVHRASTRAPIERPFCLVLSPQDVTVLTANNGWYEFRSDVPGRRGGGCFHWYE
ncbi:hypothetical protein [Streptomyces sp. Isolate_45]|uniref:hypothetical protein n=1 Tax=Streptomyces sp. Isolate_45 TaxID=2950111 RepID=UPI002481DC5C|nr:hypothetical protein [Streptomyces sp. Isolate_45]MDA5280063.1 hypothetical protein [Streptomyces sp. Isolate_45]